jgi:hypothetical protein
VSSSAYPCGHGQIEGAISVASLPDPKRINGLIYRDRIGDPVGCYQCGQVYPETLPEELQAWLKSGATVGIPAIKGVAP